MRDTRLAGSLQETARDCDIDLPDMAVPTSGGMAHHIHALDCPREACAGLQISLHPLRARPIISRIGPSTHPTHGIPGLAQVLHHQAAQSSRAACHQNMLHTISSRVSLYEPLSREAPSQSQKRPANWAPPLFFFFLCLGFNKG